AHEWEMPLVTFTDRARDSGLPIIVYHMRKPSVTFYARKPVLMPSEDDEYERDLSENARAFILARSRDEKDFSGRNGMEIIAREGRYILVSWDRNQAKSAKSDSAE
ncbi:MAG TPA: hypothetical protein V6C72_01835, partial [Chroococcales cyanobacterium]